MLGPVQDAGNIVVHTAPALRACSFMWETGIKQKILILKECSGLSALEEKHSKKRRRGRSIWVMDVWEVLTEQVTLKHFLIEVICKHDKMFKWEKYYMKNKSLISYPFSRITTVKSFLSFFSRKCFVIHLHISLSSMICFSVPIKNTQMKSYCTYCSLTVNLFWRSFVSAHVALYHACNNSFIDLHYMAVPWITNPFSHWWIFGFQIFATNVPWCTCINTYTGIFR